VRRIAAIMVIGVVVGLGSLLSPAGAQTGTQVCNYNVSPTILGPNGGTVTVQGVAPGDSNVRVFAAGRLVGAVRSDRVTGRFAVSFFLGQTAEITASIDDYPATGCGIEGQDIVRGPGATGRGLPRTGASGVGDTVMLGLVMVALGGVLVVAVRRRDGLRGRR
jgi:LPXTG-motif cell wall-anchored protein